MNRDYGKCPDCEENLVPVFFREQEVVAGVKTGRVRTAVDFLYCPRCLKNFMVDDSFDGPWK